ncbi:lipolytic enzyme [Streptomyces lunaelactis]|uniref:Lipolytic enzyme n=1 Tax=Streptomyces lunaelactis TaxID=1535768 RepID=A0A2R4SYA8_9ACTN|nr:lipolytic enzyme [Streptomyces lunaelactis]NUK88635.1 SGNH/GDSL hydrolase family protein [Streptomyces lunaelactis]
MTAAPATAVADESESGGGASSARDAPKVVVVPVATTPVATTPVVITPVPAQLSAPRAPVAGGGAAHDVVRLGSGGVALELDAQPVEAHEVAELTVVGGTDHTAGVGGAGPAPVTNTRALRFVALGDSLTEGVGDRVAEGWRGWAALLADGIGGGDAPAEFRKLAVSGALTRDVAERQTPEALAFAPDIASVLVGVNDTLRCTFDIEEMARQLDSVCARLTARGTVVLTACLPDPGSMLGLPLPLARPLARRQRAVNTVVHALSARYGAIHLHAADAAWVADRSMWSADRLHPGERGHRMIARRFHELLTERGLAHGTAPGSDPEQVPPGRAAAVLWLATAGTAWVARRCTDLLPQLLRLAGSEVRHWARGTSERLDRSAEHALSSALAAVSLDVPLARMGE